MLCSILERVFDLLKLLPHLVGSEERLYFYNVLYQYVKLTVFVGWVAACAQLEQSPPRRIGHVHRTEITPRADLFSFRHLTVHLILISILTTARVG